MLACWVSIAMGASVGALAPLLQFISMRVLTAVSVAAAVGIVLVVVALYDFTSVVVSIHTDGFSNFPDLPGQVSPAGVLCCAAPRGDNQPGDVPSWFDATGARASGARRHDDRQTP